MEEIILKKDYKDGYYTLTYKDFFNKFKFSVLFNQYKDGDYTLLKSIKYYIEVSEDHGGLGSSWLKEFDIYLLVGYVQEQI